MNETAILLDEQDFQCLVRGGILSVNNGAIKIALSDIGFHRMEAALELAQNGIDIYKNHTKE